MKGTKSKVSAPQPIGEFCEDLYEFAKNDATKEDIKYILKELEEMKAMLEEGKKRHSK